MGITLAGHVTAGALGLVLGYMALAVAKGGTWHRKAGMLFVYAMVTMAIIGAVLAGWHGAWAEVNIPAAWTTAYLVTTSLVTLRRPAGWSRRLDTILMVVALSVAAMMLTFGLQAVMAGGKRNGIPAFPFFLFGVVGLLGGAGDVRVFFAGARQGVARLRRHLWRMCFALFIAAMSFFLGQADVLPKALRIYPLLAVPVLVPPLAMFYWLWRVRTKRSIAVTGAVPVQPGVAKA